MSGKKHTKPFWASKTLWFNLVVAALAAAEAASGLLQPLLPGNIYGWLTFALTVGNTVLRVVTTSAVALRPAPAEASGEEQR